MENFLTGNIIAAVFDDVKAKNIKSAAKKLARIGIKGNLAGIAATMVSKGCTMYSEIRMVLNI